MNKSVVAILATFAVLSVSQIAKAGVIADWTFETSVPSSGGPYSPETGSGSASASGLGAISSPAGNGSSHSFSANGWTNSSAYYQFQVTTLGLSNIGVTYDQASSSTGPATFNLEYSTDGVNFLNFASGYTVQVNGAPNTPWNSTTSSSVYSFSYDLSTIAALDNASTVDFRIAIASQVAENGGAVAGTGTDRVDNFTVYNNFVPVPEPSTLALCGLGGIAGLLRLRRKA